MLPMVSDLEGAAEQLFLALDALSRLVGGGRADAKGILAKVREYSAKAEGPEKDTLLQELSNLVNSSWPQLAAFATAAGELQTNAAAAEALKDALLAAVPPVVQE